ncbi:transketolase [Pinisolibacter aquiterrae]|uniref:transketolase n=1 Tax=Pinisolibacter aquiterrae TaxID=2815579 RepID=UPI001C3CE713|nr:transketolase [Pinisolibacter aquiterrae]MBV5263090.1 transketolase [Pinisolibacter aquiterrae]MCC8234006.1 transketolase [Pinisolibacter aquiterrae]
MTKPVTDALTWKVSAAIRALAMDAVQAANSGHPGAPMGMAEIASVLWREHLSFDPKKPKWPNRDRFVLSNGHGSMLLYALLHLTGFDVSIDDIKSFRQLHSRTPGHPEFGYTPGIETTTGPLGQGIANAVGMAIAERTLAAQFNRPGHEIVDHRTWVFVGDGCLMEGVSHEVSSLAGTLGLGKLKVVWDDNGISIDGKVAEWFGEDVCARYEAYGWHVVRDVDGHDPRALDAAMKAAEAITTKPVLIQAKTVIGKGAPKKQGTEGAHGAPLGAEEIAAVRVAMDWPYAPFEIPDDVRAEWDRTTRGAELSGTWETRFAAYAEAHPDLAAEFTRRTNHEMPADFDALAQAALEAVAAEAATIATRKASQNALQRLGPILPEFMGGSADLTHSNLTNYKGQTPITRDPAGNAVLYGVREFGMTAIANGMALHGGFLPYVATFLVFSDYARNAVRMSALMKQKVVHVYTHDSIGLGEDGPTHQPVEHAEALRVIPNLDVWRPCDAVETQAAWTSAVTRADGPSALLLSRQNLAHQPRSPEQLAAIASGGYVLVEPASAPKAVIVATGSEVQLAVAAAKTLGEEGLPVRVVSMPCVEAFERKPKAEQDAVLPDLPTVVVEAGVTRGWWKIAGRTGAVIGIDRFGESAPEKALWPLFGFTAENVAATVRRIVG